MGEKIRRYPKDDERRIGVWVKNGVVFRRDSEQEPYAREYRPKDPETLERVVALARNLQHGAQMSSTTAAVEAYQDKILEELKGLVDFS